MVSYNFEEWLAYKRKMINWCLSCKIGLANEGDNNHCECGGETDKREKDSGCWPTKYRET